MGKLLPFVIPTKDEPELEKETFPDPLETFLDLFSDNIDDIKAELDFLNDLDDFGITHADTTEES